jgi:hypothetical protein
MFFKKPLHDETEAAVKYAIKCFESGRLYGSDNSNWSDAPRGCMGSLDERTLIFDRGPNSPTLNVRGFKFNLTQKQANLISSVIAMRLIKSASDA